jgi:hypothetical protein
MASLSTLSNELLAAQNPVGAGNGARPANQHSTLARNKTLIGRQFHKSHAERGVRKLLSLHHGWS